MRLSVRGADSATRVVAKVRAARRLVEDNRPAFREMGKRIDKLIRDNFSKMQGGGVPWAPLSETTENARWWRSGWYARTPKSEDEVGRWTDRMFDGLMGRGALGRTLTTNKSYSRVYFGMDREPNGKRVQWFHEGTADQPERPFWKKDERSDIARQVMEERLKGVWKE